MSKAKRRKRQTALEPMRMHERTIVFTFDAKEHKAGLNELLSTLQEDIYSTQAELVLSEDETQAKIVLKGNIVQMNNLDGFLRNIPGIKPMTDDPSTQLVKLITCYHHNLWDELDCPDVEMKLSVFVGGLAMRQALLDCPDFHAQPNLWKLGEDCYQAMEESELFTGLAVHHVMILFSFVGGYLCEQGTCELAQDEGKLREIAKLKAEVLLTEEQEGRPDILIHTFAEHLRDRLLALGMRNLRESLQALGRLN